MVGSFESPVIHPINQKLIIRRDYTAYLGREMGKAYPSRRYFA